MAKSPAWTRSEGKNPEGGLNEKGRASLRAAGHDIKRPQPEGGSRKDSFCARMKGMKENLTSSETANDPDSRINKSLRKWKCRGDGGALDISSQYRQPDSVRDRQLLKQRLLEQVLRKEKESKTPSGRPSMTTPYRPSVSTPNMSKEIYEKGNLGDDNYALAKGGAAKAASKVARRYRAFGGTDVQPQNMVNAASASSIPATATQSANNTPNDIQILPPQYQENYIKSLPPQYQEYVGDINNAYKTYLGREADQTGLGYWAEQMDKGTADLGSLRNLFLSSQEGKDYAKANPNQLVQALYSQSLGRPADEAGTNYWAQQLRQGMNPQDIYNAFAGTDEAANYETVNQIYQQNLGRNVDPEGLKYWSDMLNNGNIDAEDLGNIIHGSDEGQNYYRSAVSKNYLGRDLKPEEVKAWQDYVKSGKGTNEDIENAIINSDEAKNYDLRNFVTEEYKGLLGKQPTPEQMAEAISQLSSGKITKDQFDTDLSNSEASQLYQASNFEPYDVASNKGVAPPKQARTPFQAIKNLAAPITGAYDSLSEASQQYLKGLIGTESGGKNTAAAKTSSAKGLFQFINSTWDTTFKKVFGNNTGLTKEQARAIRTNTSPEAQAINFKMGIELMKDAEQKLKEKGLPITDANLYSVHFSGNTKLAEQMEKNPNAPVSSALGKTQLRANKSFKDMSVGKLMSTFDNKIKKNVELGQKAVDKFKGAVASDRPKEDGSPTTPKVTEDNGTVVGGGVAPQPPQPGMNPYDTLIEQFYRDQGIGVPQGDGIEQSGFTDLSTGKVYDKPIDVGGPGGGQGAYNDTGGSYDVADNGGAFWDGAGWVSGWADQPSQGPEAGYGSWGPWNPMYYIYEPDELGLKRGGRANKSTNSAAKNALDVARAYKKGGPVWDKPRPKSLGKPTPLSSDQKSSAKAMAKAAGRPYPNLVDNMRAAKKG